jgi:beta-mannosidase
VRTRVGYAAESLTAWTVAATAPGAYADPAALAAGGAGDVRWTECTAPTTAAAALRAAGAWSLDGPARRFDDEDWWWRTRFRAQAGESAVLCLDGVATVADVWLDGAPITTVDGMFAPHRIPVTLAADNELAIRCRSLTQLLAARRPRPRWRAPMVEHQQLRWFRTTLLGRTPGWSPPAAPVGPWRPVRLERAGRAVVDDLRIVARLDAASGAGRVDVSGRARGAEAIEVVLSHAGREHAAALAASGPDGARAGRVDVANAARWWPHTHGEPARYTVRVVVDGLAHELGAIGFRTIEADTAGGGFALRVNGVRVFCRGACWTPLDPVSLAAAPEAYADAFEQLVDAGMNMVRVGGTMTYEADAFHIAADARGVLVWQDLMFANMQYPDDDAAFVASAVAEVGGELARLAPHPSLAVVCGNSEGAQQAAMWGAARSEWAQPLFHDRFARLAAELAPASVYWPSSAWGGDIPFRADQGTTSYYGVGAYLRPLDDARRADVRFATECLAFANLPATGALPGGDTARVHAPAWKARTPRDLGAGWDFDDVRDHYVARLFGVDPVALRYADHERYLELGRVATGEVMAQAFGEWRRARSRTGGGLVWFLRDLWPGAGWGVVDATGEPKAAYHYLRRALAPIAVHVSDEGGNGLALHVTNDRPAPLAGALELALWKSDAPVGTARADVEVPPHGALEVPALALLEGFRDLNHAYRFGPATCDLVVATLAAGDAVLATAFHFPLGLPSARSADVGLTASLGEGELVVATTRFAQAIAIDLPGVRLADNFFHLAPGARRSIACRRVDPTVPARGTVQALNTASAIKLASP